MSGRFFQVMVKSHKKLSAGMVRLTFSGPQITEMGSTGVPDEYVRLFFPDPETGEQVLPIINEKGQWSWPEDKTRPHTQPYTIRRFDADNDEMDIDFVVHEGGLASEWAQAAKPGDTICIMAPVGLYEAPKDIAWQFLFCDATGIPAAFRIAEQTPPSVQTRMIIEVPDAAHEQQTAFGDHVKVSWLHGCGNGIAPSRLDEVLKGMPMPQGKGYFWFSAEHTVARTARRYLRHDLKLPGSSYKVVAYWNNNQAEWLKGWENLDEEIRRQIDAAWTSGRDLEEVRDEVEATLERFGL